MAEDKSILRGLAARCREIAESEKNVRLQDRWRNLNAMMVLKDTYTIEDNVDRLARWVQIGREKLS